ncbi:MAG: hypothetical protein R3F56_20180 [Planctomycetota bacterium]
MAPFDAVMLMLLATIEVAQDLLRQDVACRRGGEPAFSGGAWLGALRGWCDGRRPLSFGHRHFDVVDPATGRFQRRRELSLALGDVGRE